MADAIVILSGERKHGGSAMELTDDELSELFDILDNYTRYGDDSIVYTSAGDQARTILERVVDEAKRRKLWWGR